MRRDEEYAKEAFTRFLAEGENPAPAWTDGTEPPDFFLTLGKLQFAVEVTQVMEAVSVGSERLPYHGVAESLTRLTNRLEDRARSLDLLHGTYIIDLSPIPDLASSEANLTDRIMRYLAQTQAIEETKWEPVVDLGEGRMLEIRKYSSRGAAICEMIGGVGAKWEPEIVGEAYALIQTAIRVKTERLKDITHRKILLLIDAYHYARPDTWQASVAWPAFLAPPFHTIARIHGHYQCQVLHSASPSWLAAA